MPQDASTLKAASSPAGWLICSVGFVSAAILAMELGLLRVLLVASWHHFAFLVISIALLGFGLSGSALLLAGQWLKSWGRSAMRILTLTTAVSMPLCLVIAQHVPIEARLAPALFYSQIGWWGVYWAVLTVPFVLGAMTIGLGLMLSGDRAPTAYAANLLGSALGVAAATAAMWIVDPAWLGVVAGAIALLGAVPSGADCCGWVKQLVLILAAAMIVACWLWLDPPTIRPDPFKYSAHLDRLRRQGQVELLAHSLSPRGLVEIYRGEVFHELPFLALGATAPRMHALVIDGHWAGSILEVHSAQAAAVVDQTLMSVPYRLLSEPNPRVLLLQERSGTNIWLAVRHNAVRVDAVQSDPNLPRLLRKVQPELTALAGVNLVVADPRQFVQKTGSRYDLIQLAGLEGSAAGSGGMAGLGQDFLLTVDGLAQCIQRLNPQGMLSVCRGIQTPPRDNLKLLATLIQALKRCGIDRPQQHIVIVRDYLAACTIVKPAPWTAQQIADVRQLCQRRQLTPVWFEGITQDELNQPDVMPGPPGNHADWLHYGARELFSSDARRFIDRWQFDIRPPTDDRPFFFDFCRLRAIGAMRQAFGDLWLTRVELAYLFVLAAIAAIIVVAGLGILLPVLWSARVGVEKGRWIVAVYFGAIGLAYLLLEITLLSRLTQLIGDPVLAAAAVIAAFLLGSGLGSMAMQKASCRTARIIAAAVSGIVLLGLVLLLGIGQVAGKVAGLSDAGRIGLAVVMIFPLAVLMGMPMPAALGRLADRPAHVPWAWAVNGFASVLAAPLGTAIGMTWGFLPAGMLALGLYILSVAVFTRLPR